MLVEDIFAAGHRKKLYHQLLQRGLYRFPSQVRAAYDIYARRTDVALKALRHATYCTVDAAAAVVDPILTTGVDIMALPSMTPPYPMLWVEYVDNFDATVARSGLLLTSLDLRSKTVEERASLARQHLINADGTLVDAAKMKAALESLSGAPLLNPEVDWAVSFTSAIDSRTLKTIIWGNVRGWMYLNAQGKPISGVHMGLDDFFLRLAEVVPGGETPKEMVAAFHSLIATGATALSLMHCNNVRLDTRTPNPVIQTQRKMHGKEPHVTYHLLIIDPIRTVKGLEHEVQPSGIAMPLHWVRGHFAHYGGDRGKLFGKYEGTFFVPAHQRGSQEAGTVIKDYALGCQDAPMHA